MRPEVNEAKTEDSNHEAEASFLGLEAETSMRT